MAVLKLSNISLNPSEIHLFRGYIGNLFKEYDLIHNHDPKTGIVKYRYPLIQFKLINDTPTILAITQAAITIFSEIFFKLKEIKIREKFIQVYEKDLNIDQFELGISKTMKKYFFSSPWIGLN